MSDDAMQPRDGMTGDGAEAGAPPGPVYDQAFFLELARPREDTDEARAEARERWNAWRRDPANARVEVTFEGVDFRTEENRLISFAGFEFGGFSRFPGAKFSGWARFDRATFGEVANFAGATFEHWTFFDEATFASGAVFDGATFGKGAHFEQAAFDDEVRFVGVTFGDGARFAGATFGGGASFENAVFGDGATFTGETSDGDVVAWRRAWAHLHEIKRANLERDYRERREEDGFGPDKFSTISFARAHFLGSISFTNRSFERHAYFVGVRFDSPPDFDGATNLQRIDFTGARAGFAPADRLWWRKTDSRIAIRLRALRSQIEATKNHDFERDLYIEERKAERGIYFDQYRREKHWGTLVAHSFWILVMAVYWALSDYGRSWLRPTVWLGASIPAFDLVYAHVLADRQETAVKAAREGVTKSLAGADALAIVKGWKIAEARVRSDYDAVVGQLAVSNAVPFVGPLTVDADAKKFLFCGVWPASKGETGAGTLVEPCRPIPPPGFQAAMISQNLLSILLVFFIGLALRNYFRLK